MSADPSRGLTKADRFAVHEQLVAVFRVVIAGAYARQVRRGFTPEVIARRVGWKVAKVERLLMVPRTITIGQIGSLCFAMQCEPEFGTGPNGEILVSVRPWPAEYASAIESDATGTGAAEGESATLEEGDAQ